jgi:hypothetical protein
MDKKAMKTISCSTLLALALGASVALAQGKVVPAPPAKGELVPIAKPVALTTFDPLAMVVGLSYRGVVFTASFTAVAIDSYNDYSSGNIPRIGLSDFPANDPGRLKIVLANPGNGSGGGAPFPGAYSVGVDVSASFGRIVISQGSADVKSCPLANAPNSTVIQRCVGVVNFPGSNEVRVRYESPGPGISYSSPTIRKIVVGVP